MMLRAPPWWLAIGALWIMILLAWSNSFECGFVFDNRSLLLLDERVHQVTRENLALIFNHTWLWPGLEGGLYRPFTTLSFLFNYAILGNRDHPAGYHWINLLIHAGNSVLVFALARRLTQDLRQSFLMAALWAVHPVLTESVTNIAGRADLLAAMTSLGGLLIYLRSAESSGLRRVAWLAGLFAITAVGVFCKESAVMVIALIALYELTWWDRRRLRAFAMCCAAMAPAFLLMWGMRLRVLAASAPARFPYVDNPIVGADFWTGRLTALKVLAEYLERLAWPVHLSADYSYPQIPLADGRFTDWIAWLAMATVAIAVALLYRRNKPAFFGACFAFLAILPASNLVIPVGTIMGERLLYLPAVGFSICLTIALYSICRRAGVRGHAPLVVGILVVVAFGARTWVRNKDWNDDYTFWSAAVRTSPFSFKTHTTFAIQLMGGEHADQDRALREGERSVTLLDPLPDERNDAGIYLRTAQQYGNIADASRRRDADGREVIPPESIPKYERARTLLLHAVAIIKAHHEEDEDKSLGFSGETGNPALIPLDLDFDTYLTLSKTDDRLGKAAESLQYAEEAQTAEPLRPEAYLQIHDLLVGAGRREDALARLMEGQLLSSEPVLQQKLAADYAASPAMNSCALSYAGPEPRINYACAIVRKQVCSVADPVVRNALKALGRDAAIRLKDKLASYGCEAHVIELQFNPSP